ncbi:NAD(P)H-dependent oxidoreductase [Tenacibaculum sp. 190524A02b]|uniref:NAD(P)H-dependent FMN reductase n=1 Tax=Tenacibaculum vairaonense TaxID=3137860 RepID=A0ABM9PM81_9FLAO
MKLLIISGSNRTNSMSFKTSEYVLRNVFENYRDIDVNILDISNYPVLLHHYDGEQSQELLEAKKQVLEQLYNSDAFIVVTPEWGGMIPPALANLFLLCANGSANGMPLGHKPGFIIGISASGGGHNPVPIIKGFTAKNTHITWISLHAVINNVENFLSEEWNPESKGRVQQVQSRIKIGIKALLIYAKQLKVVREELIELSKIHPFGQ